MTYQTPGKLLRWVFIAILLFAATLSFKYDFEHSLMINETVVVNNCSIQANSRPRLPIRFSSDYEIANYVLPWIDLNITFNATTSTSNRVKLLMDFGSAETVIPLGNKYGLNSCDASEMCTVDNSPDKQREIEVLGGDRIVASPGSVPFPTLNNLSNFGSDIPKLDVLFDSSDPTKNRCTKNRKSEYGVVGMSPKSTFFKYLRENYKFKNGTFDFGLNGIFPDNEGPYRAGYNLNGIDNYSVKITNESKNNTLSWITLPTDSEHWLIPDANISFISSRTTELVENSTIKASVCLVPDAIGTLFSTDLHDILEKKMSQTLCGEDLCKYSSRLPFAPSTWNTRSIINSFALQLTSDDHEDLVIVPSINRLKNSEFVDYETDSLEYIYYLDNLFNDELLKQMCGTSKNVIVLYPSSLKQATQIVQRERYDQISSYLGLRMTQDGKFQIGVPRFTKIGEFRIKQSKSDQITVFIVLAVVVTGVLGLSLFTIIFYIKNSKKAKMTPRDIKQAPLIAN